MNSLLRGARKPFVIQLSEYPVRHRGDDVDWTKTPRERCDMNFRPPRNDEKQKAEHKELFSFTRIATVFSALAVVAITVVNILWPFLFDSVESIFLIAVAAAVPALVMKFRPSLAGGGWVYLMLIALLLISNCAAIFRGEARNNFYIAAFLFFVLPFVMYVVDQIANHYVKWVTASPSLDLKTMKTVRKLWQQRFSRIALSNAKLTTEGRVGESGEIGQFLFVLQNYSLFLFTTYGLFFVSVVFAILISGATVVLQAAILIVTILLLGLAAAVAWTFPGCHRTAISALTSYCVFRRFRNLPSVVQSPTSIRLRGNLIFCSILAFSYSVNSFWFSWGFFSITRIDSAASLVLSAVLQLTIALVLAPALLFATVVVAVGPVLWWFEKACESKQAHLAREGWSEFDCYIDRLRHSGNVHERQSIWLGLHEEIGFPILVPIQLVREHMHILGGSGTGKTGLGISTLAAQLIRRNEGPVIVIDAKGDESLMQYVKQLTEAENRKFKWFTTSQGKSTYLFNPFQQNYMESMTLSEVVGMLLLSLNLFHGADYGRSWFTAAARNALTEALNSTGDEPPDCFQILLEHLEQIATVEGGNKDAKHLLFMMRTLAGFAQLGAPTENGEPHSANSHAIRMFDVIKNKQVVYFNFESITDPSSAGELSRFVVYSVIAAAKHYSSRTGKKPFATIICDEAQHIVADNIATALEQARSLDVSLVLCHQDRGQLKKGGGRDLAATIDSCTCVKQYFSARSPEVVQYLSDVSGEVAYYSNSWRQFVFRVLQGDVSINRALTNGGINSETEITQQTGPRLTKNDIEDVSQATNRCILSVKRKTGNAQYHGAFPVHIDYPISGERYMANQLEKWPSAPGETLTPTSFWSEVTSETVDVEPGQAPPVIMEQDLQDILKKLQDEERGDSF